MTTIQTPAAAAPSRTALLLGAGAVVGIAANAIIATSAFAAGADPSYGPLSLPAYAMFTILGLIAAHLGWRIVRARAARPAAVLRVLVPVLAVLSFVPDIVLMATGFIPGTTTVGVIALMLMHLVVLGVAIPLNQRIAPVR